MKKKERGRIKAVDQRAGSNCKLAAGKVIMKI